MRTPLLPCGEKLSGYLPERNTLLHNLTSPHHSGLSFFGALGGGVERGRPGITRTMTSGGRRITGTCKKMEAFYVAGCADTPEVK